MEFVHLHVHTHYSLLDGLSKVGGLVEKAKAQGAKALAITDHGVMYGAVEFYKTCKKEGIKPIIGCEMYVVPGSMETKELKRGERNYFHLTLLAKNHTGYVNLMKMVTEAHLKGFYYKPRIDFELLQKHAEGLVCLSGCLSGQVAQTLLRGEREEAKALALKYRQLFGEDYYLEVQHFPNIPDSQKVNDGLIGLSQEIGVPLVATADSHYLDPEDADAQDVLLCVQTGSTITDENRFTMKGELFDLKSPEVMAEAFKHVPEAIENTVKIAEKCDLEIPMGTYILPPFDLPEGENMESVFDHKVEAGLKKRFGEPLSQAVRERADYEMEMIKRMGYISYFLIVADFVNWSQDNGILVGPGRGSGASSIVAYALRITNVDPLKHNLLFERFLNPERISMPDFDIDFADDRRHEVVEYVMQKYGRDRVANIITFGTMASRAAVRDVGRTLGMSYGEVDRIAKMIPPPQQGKYTPLKQHIEEVQELKAEYEGDEKIRRLLDLSIKLEGTIRHASTHAAGVVIADKPLTNYVPLQYAPNDETVLVTQYSMFPLEDIGLLKMDFLGLKNLTIIKNTTRIIRKTKGVEINVDDLPFDDEETFKLLRAADTTGVFQLESDGMKRYIKELAPTVFSDIAAMVALYRPGPIQFVEDFIARKHGRKTNSYLHPKLQPILEETYGIAVFQEQVLQIARDVCGFTLGEADVLRKAIGKKIPKLLAEQKTKFFEGAVKNGVSKSVAEQLFHFVEPFALYGFNRAHSTSYAVIAYWTAYLKAHYRSAFMAASMTSDQNDLDRIAKYIGECEQVGLKVLAPSVNKSFTDFAVVKETDEIIFGLNAIKNVGRKVSDAIVDERSRGGEYQDLSDFIKRVGKEVINRKTLESLILAGAVDAFGDRKVMFNNIDNILSFAGEYYRRQESNQAGMFADAEIGGTETVQLQVSETATDKEKLAWEREYLGTFVSRHPLKELTPLLDGLVKPIGNLSNLDDGKKVKVAGIATRIQKIFTKKGDAMLFVNLEDLSGQAEVVVFASVLEKTKELWERDNILLISGKVNVKETAENRGEGIVLVSEAKIVAEGVELIDDNIEELKAQFKKSDMIDDLPPVHSIKEPAPRHVEYLPDRVVIKLPRNFTNEKLHILKDVLAKYEGTRKVELELFAQGKWQRVPTSAKTDKSEALEKELATIF
ncbi:MAG: DNA polymerase III subunit alpha [Patescibacteria group bacterium]|nr:DNA polymerase III subunit alpha [Patescibacteria group bacterium]